MPSPMLDRGMEIAVSDNIELVNDANFGLDAYSEDFAPFLGAPLRLHIGSKT